MEFLLFAFSLIIIIKASDIFLDSSIKISKLLQIPDVIIGATIVSIGTTLPEILVSSTSAIMGHSDISYGNAIGSIICNTALISAISLIFTSIEIQPKNIKIVSIFFMIATMFFLLYSYWFNFFSRVSGIILIIIYILYYCVIVYNKKNNHLSNSDDYNNISTSQTNTNDNIIKNIVYLIVSAVFVAVSARLLTDNSILISKRIGIDEASIGLSIVAFGTSLPEFMTCIQSIRKGHSSLSIGNIIGANFINLVLVIGVSAFIKPFTLPQSRFENINSQLLIDIPIFVISMLILLLPIFIFKKTKKWQGILLIMIYILYIFYLYYIK